MNRKKLTDDEIKAVLRSLNDRFQKYMAELDDLPRRFIRLMGFTLRFIGDKRTPEITLYIFDQLPSLVEALYRVGHIYNLCVDGETFKRVTLMIADADADEIIHGFTPLEIYMVGLETAPEIAKEFAPFYQKYMTHDNFLTLLNQYEVSANSLMIDEVIAHAKTLAENDPKYPKRCLTVYPNVVLKVNSAILDRYIEELKKLDTVERKSSFTRRK